jgi:hypothetical protein
MPIFSQKRTEIMKDAAAAGTGFLLSNMAMIVVAMMFIIPAAFLAFSERKREPEEQRTWVFGVAMALALIGTVIGGGAGMSLLFSIIEELA